MNTTSRWGLLFEVVFSFVVFIVFHCLLYIVYMLQIIYRLCFLYLLRLHCEFCTLLPMKEIIWSRK